MEAVVSWSRTLKLIEPHYPKAGKGRQPKPLETMLRIYFLQQWYGLSDPAAEESLYDIESMRRFAKLEPGEDAIPDETTILNFRHLLEKHRLTSKIFEDVKTYLEEQGFLLAGGSIVDASIIHAPSSTKKGNTWHFGMKAHISVDAKSGLIHTVGVTTAKTHDAKVTAKLIRENDKAIFGDKGYVSHNLKKAAREAGVYWAVLDKAKPKKKLSATQKKRNKKHSSVRAKVEHPFRIIKCQFGYRKTRYRGLKKNATQVFSLMALADLYQVRHELMMQAG